MNRSLFVAALLVSGPLAAQSPPPQPRAREFSTSLSFVNTSGNTSVTTTGVDEKLILRPGWRWTHTQTFGVIYGKNAGEVNAENYRAGWRSEMALTPRVGTYGQVDFLRNRFKGLAAVYSYSIGLSAQLLSAPRDVISFDAGYSRVSQRATDDVTTEFNSARFAAVYRHNFTDATYLEQTAQVLPNLDDGDDLRIGSVTSLVAPISSHIGLKAGYRLDYDHQPQPGFKTTDAVLTTGLQVTF